MRIYLDNAATTPLDEEVFKAMTPYFLDYYGNPSSNHHHGRDTKHAIETSRMSIARLLNGLPEEIIFTSGGTEADNIAIVSAVTCSDIDHVITTPFEHHAVLETIKSLQNKRHTRISLIKHDDRGNLDLNHLEYLLRSNTRSLVSVMHGNNEIGNINNIERIAELCDHYGALFHTDTVQTIGHHRYDLSKLKVHFMAASAHKFHGPKGIGFLYCRKGTAVAPLIYGGGQERRLRAGTENIPGIVGLARALEIAYSNINFHSQHIQGLKDKLTYGIASLFPNAHFNGNSAIAEKSLYTILSVNFRPSELKTNLIRYLDELHISVSGGSACTTGLESHVLKALGSNVENQTVRFSFSKYNTIHEIDQVIEKLSALCKTVAA